ncbi:(d)CMP kinase [Mycoplasmopsis felis]|uniref:(d)CMP kinase n=1 Tax=Mycoplasmopsis felis TaxID=33923 RepID=UPI002FEF5713
MPTLKLKYFYEKLEERAKRRVKQNAELGFNTEYKEILYEVQKRDEQDMNRDFDPLHKTEDAVYIDCIELTIEEVVQKIIDLVNERIN